MSTDKIISNVVDGLCKIRNLLGNSDIELCLNSDKSSDTIEKSKEFIDELFELSKNLKEKFYEQYTKYQKDQNKGREENVSVPNSILSNGLVSDNSISDNGLEDDVRSDDSIDENNVTSIDDSMEISQKDTTLDLNNESEVGNSSVSMEREVKTENLESDQPQRSLIRLVDLNKLIDPDKHKKSVKFDTSVIILSSSDEESKVINNVNDTKAKSNSETKNVSKKRKPESSESENSNQNEDNKILDVESDNCRKSRRLKNVQKVKSNSREKYKKIFVGSKNKNTESSRKRAQIEVISDSSSDSETEKRQLKSTRIRSCKTDDAKLNSKVYVPLPLYQCQKLKEVYNRNKECFDTIR